MGDVTGQAVIKMARHPTPREDGVPYSVVPKHAIDSMLELARYSPAGCFVEVGVYKGGTAYHLNQLATAQSRSLYLYDTFEGIPYTNTGMGDRHKIGDFNDTSYEEVKAAIPEAIITKGIFPASMLQMPPVAFAHIDCDQYQAIIDSVLSLVPLMVSGGIFLFDDYACLEGATRAVLELFGEERIEISSAGKAVVTM